MSAADLLTPLIKEARNFSSNTDQKDICSLLSKVADAKTWNYYHLKLLNKLHCCLSTALDGRLNEKIGWDSKLKMELDKLQEEI